MATKPSQFEFRDEFLSFLPANGVPKAGSNYVTWMNRAAARLGRRIGPTDLATDGDVEQLMVELREIDLLDPSKRYLKNHLDEKNQRSAFRKYVQMVQSDYIGLFTKGPASLTPEASDLSDTEIPRRVKLTVHRIVRDTVMTLKVKRLYDFQCQVCCQRLKIKPEVYYAEAHHLQPLGGKHGGLDIQENVICLCPNHHALFDYFAMELEPSHLKLSRHKLGMRFVDYHNARVTQKENK